MQRRCFARTHPLMLLEPTHFEMYLPVILPLSLPCWREVLPYIGHIGMSSLKGYEKYSVDFGHFCLKLGMAFFALVFFKKKLYFFQH